MSRVGYEYREPPDETTGEPECPLRRIPFEDASVSKWPAIARCSQFPVTDPKEPVTNGRFAASER
jgi:hypothetical protein